MATNDTAALVVALSAQVSKFEKDLAGAVAIADKKTREIETSFSRLNSSINGQFSKLSVNLSGNLGFLGPVLTALGTAGVAAAVGIGAIVGGVLALVDATTEFANKARLLKEGSENAGLTITQFKLLGQAGKLVGLDFEETTNFFTRFIANLSALRQGGGPLYDALLKIDVGLLRQLSTTKDSATAVNLLVEAFSRLDDQTKKLDLAKAAGGRAGLTGARLLDSLANQGGLRGLEAKGAEAIDEKQIERAADLKVQIDAIAAKTKNIWGGMFSDIILTHQRDARLEVQQIALFLEKIVGAKERAKALGDPIGTQATNLEAQKADLEAKLAAVEAAKQSNEEHRKALVAFGFTKKQIDDEIPALKGLEESYEKLKIKLKEVEDQLQKTAAKLPVATFNERFGNFPLLPGATPPPPPPTVGSPSAELAILQKNLSLLGDAVTQGEQWKQKRLEIAAAAEKGGLTDGIAQRALAAFSLVQRAAALGARERIGIATEQQIVEVKLAQLEQDRRKFQLSDNEVQTATVVILREAKQAADALTVRQSYLPGLKQLEIDAGSLRKNLDDVSTASLNNLTTALSDIVTGTNKAGDAFKALGLQVVRSLSDMVIKMAIVAPIARALQASLGSFAFPGAGGPSIIPLTGIGGIGHAASGGSFGAGAFSVVGERGPELVRFNAPATVVPNDVSRGLGGGDVNVNYAPNVTISGSQAITPEQLAVVLANERAKIVPVVRDAVRRRAL